ncbi:hypothetical protein BHE74_00054364, partial [Ensete ventricosum]
VRSSAPVFELAGSLDLSKNLRQLESLDLSKNLLDGEIPSSISGLNYLSYLNLSYNNLSGRIPVGNQMQTLTDPTIHAGNPDLCGTPLTNKCTGDEAPGADEPVLDARVSDESETLWFLLGMMIGFVVGFWTFWCILSLKKAWRISSYFRMVDKMALSNILRIIEFCSVVYNYDD